MDGSDEIRKRAIEIAVRNAKKAPPPYFTTEDTFVPHEWVVAAVIEALTGNGGPTQEEARAKFAQTFIARAPAAALTSEEAKFFGEQITAVDKEAAAAAVAAQIPIAPSEQMHLEWVGKPKCGYPGRAYLLRTLKLFLAAEDVDRCGMCLGLAQELEQTNQQNEERDTRKKRAHVLAATIGPDAWEQRLEEIAEAAFWSFDHRVKHNKESDRDAFKGELRLACRELRIFEPPVRAECNEGHGTAAVAVSGWVIMGIAIENIEKGARIQLEPSTGNVSGYRRDDVRLAMELAAVRFGESDGFFNAAGFSAAFCKLARVAGPIDGELVRAILRGRDDVKECRGGAHFQIQAGR